MGNIMAIVRAVLGALIGIGYGLLVGVVTFQLMQLTYDPRYPGAMIPDAAGWARLTAFFAAVMTGFFGMLVGVVVGVARAGATRGAVIGVSFGLGMFLMLTVWAFADQWSWLMREPAHVGRILLIQATSFFVAFPIGLTLVGWITGLITTKLKS